MTVLGGLLHDQLIKALGDKTIEKRRQATAEVIEKVKDLIIHEGTFLHFSVFIMDIYNAFRTQ